MVRKYLYELIQIKGKRKIKPDGTKVVVWPYKYFVGIPYNIANGWVNPGHSIGFKKINAHQVLMTNMTTSKGLLRGYSSYKAGGRKKRETKKPGRPTDRKIKPKKQR